MKLIDMTCSKCGAQLKVNVDNSQVRCEFCGASLLIDDEVQRLRIDGAEKVGYDFEKGRQRAQAEAQQSVPTNFAAPPQQFKKHGVGWWIGMVLLWICFLPIMATIFVVRNQNLSRNAKIGIVAAIWVACILIYTVSPKDNTSSNTISSSSAVTTVQESSSAASVSSSSAVAAMQESSSATSVSSSTAESNSSSAEQTSLLVSKDNPYGTIDAFVNQYNNTHDVKITDTVKFDPHQEHETGGPYSRVEYRLGAYTNSVGLHGILGNDTIDLVSSGGLGDYSDFRIYIDQNDKDYERTLGYAHDVVDTCFVIAGYSVPNDEKSEYEGDWANFDEDVRSYDYAYADSKSLHYNDYPVTFDVSMMTQRGKAASLLVDFEA